MAPREDSNDRREGKHEEKSGRNDTMESLKGKAKKKSKNERQGGKAVRTDRKDLESQ